MTGVHPFRRIVRRLILPFASGGLILVLGGLVWLRRNPDSLDDLYHSGNILNTHEASGYTLIGFGQSAGHVEFLVVAALVAACTVFAVRRVRAAVVAIISSFALIFVDSVTRYATTVAGHVYVGMCDDALISMRYARNFAAGRGLVYNAGEAVDGFTNPLWTFFMVIPHAFGLHEGTTTVPILALAGLLLLASGLFTRATLASQSAPLPVQVLVTLAVLMDASAFEFTVSGLETPLLVFGSSLVVHGGLRDREWQISLGLSLLTLARADGAVVAALLVGWLLIEEAATTTSRWPAVLKRRWRRVALVPALGGLLVIWRYAIYGHAAPNTYYLKVYPFADRIGTGLAEYGVRGIVSYGLPAMFVLWGSSADERARRARRMLLPVVGVWLYSIYIGGDAFIYLRFLGPATPLLWTAVGLSATAGWSKRTPALNAALFAVIAVLVPVESERGVLGSTWDRAGWIRANVMAAKTLEHNVPRDASIATFFAGMPYYAANRRFVDLLGKTESHIAHERQIHGAVPGHNKFDFSYVYREKRPDVTFTAMHCDEVERFLALALEDRSRRAELPRFVYQAPVAQLLDDTFVEHYAGHRVVLLDGDAHTGHPIGCWFVAEGSPVSTVWHVARD